MGEYKIANGKDDYKHSMFNKSSNIVAVIDPTYKSHIEASQTKSCISKGIYSLELLRIS